MLVSFLLSSEVPNSFCVTDTFDNLVKPMDAFSKRFQIHKKKDKEPQMKSIILK